MKPQIQATIAAKFPREEVALLIETEVMVLLSTLKLPIPASLVAALAKKLALQVEDKVLVPVQITSGTVQIIDRRTKKTPAKS